MRRSSHITLHCTAAILVTMLAAACTMDITAPVEPPLETWDPAFNTHPDGQMYQELLNRYVHAGLPGVVLYVKTPRGQWNGAAGYARIESGDPMCPAHLHHAASVIKMYTATAVMLLAEDGMIDLDTKISQYLPKSVYGRVPNGSGSTVRQLLGHTSGIPDFGVLKYDLDTLNDPLGSYSPGRMLSYVENQSSFFPPGTGYFYSNTNYYLLAMLMDHVTGTNHADIISERIIKPLGLHATYYRNDPAYPKPPGLVNSYQDIAGNGRLMNVTDMTTHYAGMLFGHSGLIASSADYAVFIEALLDGRVVSQTSLTEMLEQTECSCYGLGLGFIQTPFGPGIGHSGGDFGILSEVRHFPDIDATLVLLVNGGNNGAPERLFNRLRDEIRQTALGSL